MEYIRRLFLRNKGFSLAELVIYLGILGLSVGVFTSVLDTVTKTQVEQSTQNEISGQLTFSMQTIQRLIKTSSVIDLEAGVATSTLVLQMPQEAISPTTIYLQDGTIYLTQGENAPVQALTSDAVTVDSLEFRKSSQPGAKDVVQIDLAISQFEPSQGDMVTRSLRSAVSRVSAVTFDSHLLPPTDGQYDVGSATLRWRDGYFSGKITPGEICLGAECKSSWGAISGVSGSGSPNYLAKWQTSGSITSSIIIDTGSRVGIGVLNPSARVHIANDTTSIPALLIKGATSQTGDVVQIIQNSGSTAGAHFTSQGNNVKFQLKSTGDGSTQIELNPGSTSYFVNGQVGIGTASPDTNYKLTLSGGGIKSENTSSQPAGYFSSTGGGKAIQTGSGSILFGSLAGSGSRTLVVDATGLVSATTTSSGTISGSGASGYLPVWSGSTSLATSTVYETGGNVGIGTTNPQAKLDIYGSLDQIRVTHSSSPTFYTTYTTNGLDARGTGQIYKFSIEGSEKVRIDNTGNVGIGITPAYKLDVAGNTRLKNIIFQNIDAYTEMIQTGNNLYYKAYSHQFYTPGSGTDIRLKIDLSGNVGIGNSSPAYKLDVTGDARFTQPVLVGTPTLDGHATTKSYVDSAVSSGVGSGVSGTTNYISKFTSSNVVGNSSIYETGGNIGIGTTNPVVRLHIRDGGGGGSVPLGAYDVLTVENDNINYLNIISPTTQRSAVIFSDDTRYRGAIGYSHGDTTLSPVDSLFFVTAGSSRMVIDSSGNVGIGNLAPSYKLDINGSIRADDYLYLGGTSSSRRAILDNDDGYLRLNHGNDYTNGTYTSGRFRVDNSVTFNEGGADYDFRVEGVGEANALFVQGSNGNVGIGNSSPGYKLDVSGTGQFTQPVIVGTPTAASHAATKSYVDSAAVGQSGWTDGGSNVYLTTTSDNVGIGTTSPTAALTINNGNHTQQRIENDDPGEEAAIRFRSRDAANANYLHADISTYAEGGYLGFKVPHNNTPGTGYRLVIRDNGTVGIGTTSPQSTLHINQGGDISTGFIKGIRLQGLSNSFQISAGVQGVSNTTFGIADVDNSTYRLVIESGGDVGIGTTNPSYKLEVAGTGSFSQPVIVGSPTAASHATTKSYVDSAISSGIGSGVSGTTNYIAKFTSSNVVGNSQIFDNGTNVGIGITSPDTKVHVYDGNSGGAAYSGAELTIEDDSRTIIQLLSPSTSDSYVMFGDETTANVAYIGYDHPTDKMVFNSGGDIYTLDNFSIGTTSQTVFSSLYPGRLSVVSSGNLDTIIAKTDPSVTNAAAGVFHQSSATPGFDAVRIQSVGSSSIQAILNVLSGVSDTTGVGGTSRFFVRGDGNVGIGTASPSYKLDVSGTGNFTQPVLVGTPTAASHAATKSYVDSAAVGQSGWTDGGTNVYLTTTSDNVGIGTTNPALRTEINGPIGYPATNGTSQTGILRLSQPSTVVLDMGISGASPWGAWFQSTNKNDLSLTYPLLLNPNGGNIGIGTTNPGGKVDIYTAGTNTLRLSTNSHSNNQSIEFYSVAGAYHKIVSNAGSGNLQIRAGDGGSGHEIQFYTDGTYRGEISSAGTLSMSGGGSFTQPVIVGTPTAATHATTKSYVDSAVSSGVSGGISGTQNYIAKFGATGNTVGNSQIFDNGTNVGIGTASPATKLDVSGRARFSDGFVSNSSYRYIGSFGHQNYYSNGYLLSTNIDYDNATQSGMHTIRVQGYAYGSAEIIDFSVSFYLYGSGLTNRVLTNYGSYDPGTVYLGYDGNKLQLWWSNIIYYSSFNVFMDHHPNLGGSYISESEATGWTLTDAVAPTNKVTVEAKGTKIQGTASIDGSLSVNKASPSYTLDVTGTGAFTQPVIVGTPTAASHATTKSYVDSAITTGTGSYVLKAGDTMTGTLAFAAGSADRLNMNGNNIIGVNKLTVTTIDPVYEINNKKYATYVSDTIGLKMEHYGKITTRTKEQSSYVSIIDFSKEKEGSDLWLFWQTIDEGDNMKDIIITMTPEDNVNSWYNIIPEKKQIKIFTSSPTTLSYHLVAPRHDSDTWSTHLPADHKEKGTVLELRN